MTSWGLLIGVGLAQAAILSGCVILILLHRRYRLARAAWLQPRRLALEAAMRRWAGEDGTLTRVLECLARMPVPAAVDALVSWASRVPGERWDGLSVALQGEPWTRRLRADGTSRRWWKRLECARYLSVAPVATDVAQLVRLVKDTHAAVHVAAVTALERIEAAELTLAALERLPGLPTVLQAYYSSVLRRSRPVVVQYLLERLGDFNHPALARWADFAGRLGDPALRERLTALADHASLEVRVQAARALGPFPHRASVAALTRLVCDDAWEVRAQAVRSLGMIADPATLSLAQACLRDPVWWVRLRGALALIQFAAAGRNALLAAEVGADPHSRDIAKLILGLPPQTLAEFAT